MAQQQQQQQSPQYAPQRAPPAIPNHHAGPSSVHQQQQQHHYYPQQHPAAASCASSSSSPRRTMQHPPQTNTGLGLVGGGGPSPHSPLFGSGGSATSPTTHTTPQARYPSPSSRLQHNTSSGNNNSDGGNPAAAVGTGSSTSSASGSSPRIRFAAAEDANGNGNGNKDKKRSRGAAVSGGGGSASGSSSATSTSSSSSLMGWLSWRGGRGNANTTAAAAAKQRSLSPSSPATAPLTTASSPISSPTPILVRRDLMTTTSNASAGPGPSSSTAARFDMRGQGQASTATATATPRRSSLDSVGPSLAPRFERRPPAAVAAALTYQQGQPLQQHQQHQQHQQQQPYRRQASPRGNAGGLSIDVGAAQGLQEPVVVAGAFSPSRRSMMGGCVSPRTGSPSRSPSSSSTRSSRPRSRGPSSSTSPMASPRFDDHASQQQQQQQQQHAESADLPVTINGYRVAAAASSASHASHHFAPVFAADALRTWTPTLGAMPFERIGGGPPASRSWDNLAAWPMHRSSSEPSPVAAAAAAAAGGGGIMPYSPHLHQSTVLALSASPQPPTSSSSSIAGDSLDDAMADAEEEDEEDESVAIGGGGGGDGDDAFVASDRASRRLSSRRMSGQSSSWTPQETTPVLPQGQHRLSMGGNGLIYPKRRSLSVDADANASFLPAFNIIPATPDGAVITSNVTSSPAIDAAMGAESEIIETEYRAAPRILAQAFDSQPPPPPRMSVDSLQQESVDPPVEETTSRSDLPSVRPLALSGKKSSSTDSLARRAVSDASAPATHTSSSSISSMTTASSSSSSGHSSSASTASLMSMMSTSSSLAIYAEIDEALDSLLGRVSPSTSLEELDGRGRTPTPTKHQPQRSFAMVEDEEQRNLTRGLSGLGFGNLDVDAEDDPAESTGVSGDNTSTSSPYALTTPRLQALEDATSNRTPQSAPHDGFFSSAGSPCDDIKTPRMTSQPPFTWPVRRSRDSPSDASMISEDDGDRSSTRSSAMDGDDDVIADGDSALDDLDSASIRLVASKTTLASPVRTEFGAGWGITNYAAYEGSAAGAGAGGYGNGWAQYATSEEGEIGIAL